MILTLSASAWSEKQTTIKTIAFSRTHNTTQLCAKAKLTPSGRLQWGWTAKTTDVTEPKRCSQHWDTRGRQNKPLPPATRAEKHLRLHDCHSQLTLLSWLWRSPRIFLSSVYLRFSWRAEKDLRGHSCRRTPRMRRVWGWVLRQLVSDTHTGSVYPQRRGAIPVIDDMLAFFLNNKNRLVGLFH